MKASDCVNGTWLEDLGVTDYNTITKKYLQHRSTTMVPVLFDCHQFHKMSEEQEIQENKTIGDEGITVDFRFIKV